MGGIAPTGNANSRCARTRDVILAAQAIQLQTKGYEVTIVTTNVGHLAQFVTASHWQDLPIDRD